MNKVEAQELLQAYGAARRSIPKPHFAADHWRYPPEIEAFFRIAASSAWADRQYEPSEQMKRLHDPAFIANADIDQLRAMFTALGRAERFSDGAWKLSFETGIVDRLMNRLVALFAMEPFRE